MSIQGTFNQGLALASGLLALNPQIQQMGKDRVDIKNNQDIIANRKQLADQVWETHKDNTPLPTGLLTTMLDEETSANKKLADIKPQKFGEDYAKTYSENEESKKQILAADGKPVTARKIGDEYAIISYAKASDTKRNIKQGMDDREKILKNQKEALKEMKYLWGVE